MNEIFLSFYVSITWRNDSMTSNDIVDSVRLYFKDFSTLLQFTYRVLL